MSKKRNATTPQGGTVKDSRISTSNSFSALDYLNDQEEGWIQAGRGRGGCGGRGGGHSALRGQTVETEFGLGVVSTPPQATDPDSYANRVKQASPRGGQVPQHGNRRASHSSQSSNSRAFNMGDKSLFVTPRPDGGLRDDLVVQCQTINGKPFRGTVTFKEAKFIFEDKLGYERSLLHSIRTYFNGCPVIKFKLNQQINIDDLVSVEYFELERKYSIGKETKTDTIQCRIMGIRTMQSARYIDPSENNIRWVKIEGCEYTLEDSQILDWLKLYGDPVSPICEDIHEDSDSEAEPIGNGTYSVKMKLDKDIPQFLPMYGRRIRVYYKGINKLCTQCFGSHTRRQCQNAKVPWIHYVRDYMSNNKNVGEMLFGKWWDIIDKEFPGYFDALEDKCQDKTLNEGENGENYNPLSDGNITNEKAVASQQSEQRTSRPTRDPRLQPRLKSSGDQQIESRDMTEQVELSNLMARGLTLQDAKSYRKNKKDQADIERKMASVVTSNSNMPGRRSVEYSTRGCANVTNK